MLEKIVGNAPLFLLVAARCFALIMTLPLFSSKTVSRLPKVALAFYLAYFEFPQLLLADGLFSSYGNYLSPDGNFSLEYILLLIGEAMIGAIIGFYVNVIFAAFSTAGQFFAFQMGFAASSVYDSMSEVENPLMGEFLNFLAMLVFLQTGLFQSLFTAGLGTSFKSLNVFSILEHSDRLAGFMMGGLTTLFHDALIISLPIVATLFLVNVTVGILSKAAPQMNLLAEGFPILILSSFLILAFLLPHLIEFFAASFRHGFKDLQTLFSQIGYQIGGGQ
ncbi:MAG: flagellar biosynthetic protein FliR [Treponema sp.]|nr:flagellar biosynthetic protein FliR [Treponema sp.]